MSGRRKGKSIIVVFLAPAVLLYTALFLYPVLDAFRISLYDWKGFNFANAQFIGLGNFVEAFGDKWVLVSLRNALYISLIGGVLIFGLALFFAVALTLPRIKGKGFFQTTIFFPYLMSGVGVGLFWTFVFNPTFGILNSALRAAGLERLAIPWLGLPGPALGAVIFVTVWWGLGFYMIFLMAGIRAIPPNVYDAARIDGANERQLFRYVTLPLLRDFLAIALVYWLIEALKVFDVVWVMTQGGPGNQTQVLTTYMYRMAFGSGTNITRLGYGTSIAVILFGLVFMASLLFFIIAREEAVEL